MTSGNSEKVSDVDKAREWLDRTAEWLEQRLAKASSVPQIETLRVAALLGQGYAALAQAEVMAVEPEPIRIVPSVAPAGYVEGLRRAIQVVEESREAGRG